MKCNSEKTEGEILQISNKILDEYKKEVSSIAANFNTKQEEACFDIGFTIGFYKAYCLTEKESQEKQNKKQIVLDVKKENDYPLIPMSEITDEAREIAVAWMECDDRNWIEQKHKLASDIMNYARRFNEQVL